MFGYEPEGYAEFVANGHSSYGNGLIRFLLPGLQPCLEAWNGPNGWKSEWPKHSDRLIVVAYDWMGRLYALDRKRSRGGEMLSARFEPGAAELLVNDCTFAELIGTELVEFANDILSTEFFSKWRAAGGAAPSPTQCVGYKTPLFLGGADELDNLELADLDVYLSVCGQFDSAHQ